MDPPSLSGLSLEATHSADPSGSSKPSPPPCSTLPSDIIGLETGVWAALSVSDASWETHHLFRHAHPRLPSDHTPEEPPHVDAASVVCSNVPADRLAPYLSPDVQMLYPGGMLLRGTNAVRDALCEAQPWSKFGLRDAQVVFLGGGADGKDSNMASSKELTTERPSSARAAVITYIVKARTEEHFYEALVSSTWALDSADRWILCTHQQTPVRE